MMPIFIDEMPFIPTFDQMQHIFERTFFYKYRHCCGTRIHCKWFISYQLLKDIIYLNLEHQFIMNEILNQINITINITQNCHHFIAVIASTISLFGHSTASVQIQICTFNNALSRLHRFYRDMQFFFPFLRSSRFDNSNTCLKGLIYIKCLQNISNRLYVASLYQYPTKEINKNVKEPLSRKVSISPRENDYMLYGRFIM